jgi:hypothetical protein
MICPYCNSEMVLWEMYHPLYGVFYERYDDYSEPVSFKKNINYGKVKRFAFIKGCCSLFIPHVVR